MRFTTTVDEEARDSLDCCFDNMESNDLQELCEMLKKSTANDFHHSITEWDLDNVDVMGVPEIVASARLCHIEPKMNDLQDFVQW